MEAVESLVRQIMRFLGLTISSGVKVTTAFLRWMLAKLFSFMSILAGAAVSAFG